MCLAPVAVVEGMVKPELEFPKQINAIFMASRQQLIPGLYSLTGSATAFRELGNLDIFPFHRQLCHDEQSL
jgi:hypothetical protein